MEKKKEEQERLAELAKEEERKKLIEEQKQREYEEYLKLKAEFTIEEQGCEADQSLDENNVFRRFVNYIKESKVVNIDELAAHFKLRSQAAIDRLHQLLADGIISGVIDDRGKFIYITEDEMKAVAKFIIQRGRVSVDELIEYSNKLIKFEPEIVHDVACQ
ncbi:unnamed protein product [Soboliphyme baturini]|uniref:DDRGK domain-containing protein 1 n=1 Tax=Soboliphyme baturini TaxID=241478 RepID=A0A183IJR2_9BILA|nr:unnamed protein product [Soboliphyme baturini]